MSNEFEKLRDDVHKFYITAQADGLDEAAFEDRLYDLVLSQRLQAVEEYQSGGRPAANLNVIPLPGDNAGLMEEVISATAELECETSVALEPGMLRVATIYGGFTETPCYFFNWEGLRLCVSKGIDPIRIEHWKITEPVSGMAMPGVEGKTAVDTYANFMVVVPHYANKKFKTSGKTGLAEHLKFVASENPEEARRTMSKKNV